MSRELEFTVFNQPAESSRKKRRACDVNSMMQTQINATIVSDQIISIHQKLKKDKIALFDDLNKQ